MPRLSFFPVAGASGRDFSNSWGAPRSGGRGHEGVDIFAPYGTPLVAVADGVITKAGNSGIGGLRIWLNGAFYYAHLSGLAKGIKAGTRVKAGQVIGYVGDSGNAKGTPAHLHFGWDPTGSQSVNGWKNPYQFLSKLVEGSVVSVGRSGMPTDGGVFSAPDEPQRQTFDLPIPGPPDLPTAPPQPGLAMAGQPGEVDIGYTSKRREDAWDLVANQAGVSEDTRMFASRMKRGGQ
jgi:murein DD-endopeptidase MepM/ murein hydrolase activator NlpD